MKDSFSRPTGVLSVMLLVILLAFGLRMVGLAEVPPRWDEGWTVAHASLDLGALLTITSADVHPPLFYLLLGGWQWLTGINLFAGRYLAVLVSLPSVPLAYIVALRWGRRSSTKALRLAMITAICMAWMPLGVYYSAVIRMYALAPSFVLLATWAGFRLITQNKHIGFRSNDSKDRYAQVDRLHAVLPAINAPSLIHPLGAPSSSLHFIIAFVIGAAGAMLTLYHAAWSLLALGTYLIMRILFSDKHRRLQRMGQLLVGVIGAILIFLPWGVYAIPQLLYRATGASANVTQQYPISYFLRIGVEVLTMSQKTGFAGILVILVIMTAGLAIAITKRSGRDIARLLLPVLMIVLTLVAVATAARSWAFNARMLICAVPALAMMIAWGLDRMMGLSKPLAGIAFVALIAVYFSTSSSFIYQKTLEVFDPYNPHTYIEHIAPTARSTDQVIFNVLSPAGFYALDRRGSDPSWTYALTWDPVIEPQKRWEDRVSLTSQNHQRLWLVLYKGLAGKNGDLRGWLDSTFYPASATWGEEEVFYGLYGANTAVMTAGAGSGTHWMASDGFDLQLIKSELPRSVHAGDIIPVALTWRAQAALKQNIKVFVHAQSSDGNIVAQHDAAPLNDLRPMTTLPVGADVLDHHGLALPLEYRGSIRLFVGLYDPQTGQRLQTNKGTDQLDIGQVDVVSETQ